MTGRDEIVVDVPQGDTPLSICRGADMTACTDPSAKGRAAQPLHPAVLEATGVDSERYTGWAFGMGPARIALSRYGIPDIRLLYDSDVRFLEQAAAQLSANTSE